MTQFDTNFRNKEVKITEKFTLIFFVTQCFSNSIKLKELKNDSEFEKVLENSKISKCLERSHRYIYRVKFIFLGGQNTNASKI